MKAALAVRTFLAVAVFVVAGHFGATAADAPKFEQYKNIVDLQFMKENATIPVKDGILVIDARPSRKFDAGHIPGSINIPDTSFAKMTDKLPADKGTHLVFYCGGLKCPLSHKSAFKAEKLGYTNISVYAQGEPVWTKDGNLISVSEKYVKKLIDKKAAYTLVDSRPKRKVKSTGSVPTAINIPDTFFKKMTDQLPADKDQELIFFCGGFKCPLSPKSANKAIALGYTNVKVFQAGHPAWLAAYGKTETTAAAGGAKAAAMPSAALEIGPDGDTVTVASFKKILEGSPDAVHVIDVRDAAEFEGGSIKGAVNIPVDEIEDKVAELPSDKPIVFVCATGARSGEAYDIVSLEREDLKMYFLDAEITYGADGSYEMKAAGS
jgi:rhodanese-related sulfurtransferase